ncbi:MAG: peptidoglycan DD-metalloendopeptidase family protein [Desulfobulbales bacterium]
MQGMPNEQRTSPDTPGKMVEFRLRSNISIPVVLLIILFLGTLAGIGFFLKGVTLQARIAQLEVENAQLAELQTLKMSNEWLKNRVAVLQKEKAAIVDSAVADLNEKSRIIEQILNSVGVDIPVEMSTKNSGGPFTSSAQGLRDKLMLKTERYLDTIQNIPLGPPVPGVITSKFGRRTDPINGKQAYHQGLDIRGRTGSDVKATADGRVTIQSYDKGNGRYVVLDHGNGFRTKYAHLKKSLVQKGDAVSRGQVVGLLGSTGRSTGPHVHYEIYYDDKILNPIKFVRIAKYLNKAKNRK